MAKKKYKHRTTTGAGCQLRSNHRGDLARMVEIQKATG
jgi:hypothetical protein